MKRIIIFMVIGFVIASCEKDSGSEAKPDVTPNPTPMSVSYPAWVKIFAGDMAVDSSNLLTVEGVALGRKLFYEPMLSNTQTMSCATCHLQEHGFTDPNPFSKGTNNQLGDRNAMQIINLAWSKEMFWDGRSSDLVHQAFGPVVNPIEMANTWQEVTNRLSNHPQYPSLFKAAFGSTQIDSNKVAKAIAQFEKTLVSFNSRFDKYYFEGDTTVFSESEKRGLQVFMKKGDCNHCHTDVLLTDNAFRNNGLDLTIKDKGLGAVTGKSADDGKFKVPTLRNIEVTGPYMHDSRFKTLMEVVEFYNSGVHPNSPNIDENMEIIVKGINLTNQEKQDLVAFMKTLTDQQFLTNPAFKKPN